MTAPVIEINNLNKSFGGLQAVQDVSFAVPENSIKAVIGPNGAGKTTLFNLISGALPLDSGSTISKVKRFRAYSPIRSLLAVSPAPIKISNYSPE